MEETQRPGDGGWAGSGTGESSGATDVFGVMPEAAEEKTAVSAEKAAAGAPSEPLVHRVVVGEGQGGEDDLLKRMRSVSVAQPPEGKASEPVRASAAPAMGSGGFTQLLRTLPQEPAKAGVGTIAPQIEGAAASPATAAGSAGSAAGVGGFTSLLRTLGGDETKPAETKARLDAVKTALPGASHVELMGTMPEASAAEVEVETWRATPASAAVSGEATESAKAKRTEEAAALYGAQVSGAQVSGAPVSAQVSGAELSGPQAAGGFTQLFRAIQEDAGPSLPHAAPNAVPETRSPTPAGSFTQLFGTLDAGSSDPAHGQAKADGPAAEGGSTGVFRGAGVEVRPPTAIASGPKAAEAGGSFTQLFRTLDADAGGAPRDVVAGRPSGPGSDSASGRGSDPGSMTDVFRALGNDVGPPVQPERKASEPGGGFTQLFRALDGDRSGPPETAPYGAPSQAKADPLTAMLSGSGAAERSLRGLDRRPEAGEGGVALPPMGREPQESRAGGSLTQLLRTLDQPMRVPEPRREEPLPRMPGGSEPGSPDPGSSGPVSSGPGLFTQTYQGLAEAPAGGQAAAGSRPGAPSYTPAAPIFGAPGNAPMAVEGWGGAGAGVAGSSTSGPSEVTKILEASRLREAGLRGGGPAPGAGVQGGGAAASQPGMSVPALLPGMSMPAMPAMPNLSNLGAAPMYAGATPVGAASQPGMGAGSLHLPQTTTPAMPTAPAMPSVPAMPAAPAAMGKMQQYLPLLLIVIIFLLIVILVTVVFLLKH